MEQIIKDIKNKLGGKRADHFLRFVYKYHNNIWRVINPDTDALQNEDYILRFAKEMYHFRQTYSDFTLIKDIINSHGFRLTHFVNDYYFYQYRKKSMYRTDVRDSCRDNKDSKVGNGGYNANKIRYSKQCRKTAWKRFYRLFPHLNQNK